MLYCNDLFDCVSKIKIFAKILQPYTFPLVSLEVEEKFAPMRCWIVDVDGWRICVNYSETIINDNLFKNLQIFSLHLFSLPFHISFKIASLIIVNDEITPVYYSFIKDGKKVDSWAKMTMSSGEETKIKKNQVEIIEYMGKKVAVITSF
jgi:hypothetical protein